MRVFAGTIVLFSVLQGAASWLGSTRGEWGVVVASLVVVAALGVQRILHCEKWKPLGLLAPNPLGLLAALAQSAALIAFVFVYTMTTGAQVRIEPNAPWLLLGILAQGGVAEELVFRGYLFGHIRRLRPFWRAVLLSAIPFAAVHVTLFFTLPWTIALAALAMSFAIAPPMARLYELAGRTIWAPALLHAVLQAAPKLIALDVAFPLVWMLASTIVAWSVFFVPRTD